MRDGWPLTTPTVFPLKIGVEPSQNVLSPAWCLKLRLTIGVHIAFRCDEFRGPRSHIIRQVPLVTTRILFSDEAHFWLNGYVNKQNCRIWSEANPQVYVKTPLHPEKLTVWCALWAGGIIGPYFFKNDEGHNVTVNGDRYTAMITNFFIPKLNNHDVQELWFQQDGVTCHTARVTIDLLKDTFGDRLISRFGPVNWPPRSCDLTPLDYFLWGYVKSLVYADKPQTVDHLEDNIRRVIADIRPQMLEKVIKNWTSRLDYIRASRGSPMPEIIFKMVGQVKVARTTEFQVTKKHSNGKEIKDAWTIKDTSRHRLTGPDPMASVVIGASSRSRLSLNIMIRIISTIKCYFRTAKAGSDVVQSGRPIFDDFFQRLWPYIGNNTANVVFQMVNRLWLIRIDQ
ncbi:uncharacterized protein TNCV_2063881 [Trichonephila clavipes]|nr:uncharacterized protein TNCV_2063881 [Trichonephila clavipes]